MAKKHLYEVISSRLRDEILSGAFRPGDLIPSENDLAQSYITSRGTVRQSLRVLEREGLIRSAKGKGYFVCPPAHTRFLMEFSEGDDDPGARYQQITVGEPDPDVRGGLSLAQGQPVVIIRKTIERGGAPVAFDEKFIPYEKGVPTVEQELHFAQFPQPFGGRQGVPVSTDMEIGISPAPGHVGLALGCPEGTALLTVSRYIRTGDGRCVGFARHYLTQAYGKLTAASRPYASLTP